MPPIVPSRLAVGIDVPWVTSWSEEIQGGVGPCPTVDGAIAALQRWKPGAGKPLYARNHLRRQRDSVRAMLCPMCGQATETDDRWSQTGRFQSAGRLRAQGFGKALPVEMEDDLVVFNAGAIAPLHMACARASLQRCPHLGTMTDRGLKAFPPAWIVVPLYVEARQPVTNRALRAVSFLQLLGLTQEHDPDWRSRIP